MDQEEPESTRELAAAWNALQVAAGLGLDNPTPIGGVNLAFQRAIYGTGSGSVVENTYRGHMSRNPGRARRGEFSRGEARGRGRGDMRGHGEGYRGRGRGDDTNHADTFRGRGFHRGWDSYRGRGEGFRLRGDFGRGCVARGRGDASRNRGRSPRHRGISTAESDHRLNTLMSEYSLLYIATPVPRMDVQAIPLPGAVAHMDPGEGYQAHGSNMGRMSPDSTDNFHYGNQGPSGFEDQA